MKALRRLRADPFARSIIISVALILGGFVAIGLAWRGAARSLIVAEQLPFIVSGGVGGLALVVAGAGMLAVQASRYWDARERRQLDRLVARASGPAQERNTAGSTSRVSAPPK
ncbi:MAG TPA: hypothetical protein VJ818_07505 [Actinomycetota bacterium]|nr:hypothetical protein [Actinomycetota bacterium]